MSIFSAEKIVVSAITRGGVADDGSETGLGGEVKGVAPP